MDVTSSDTTEEPVVDEETIVAEETSEVIEEPVVDEDAVVATFEKPKPNFDMGVFTVTDPTGEVGVDFLFDGGGYGRGELAIFSTEGMEEFEFGSSEFIKEAARRGLSNSELGNVVISDSQEGARFKGELPREKDFNFGEYRGVKTFQMRSGDKFAVMLVPNNTLQKVFDNPEIEGASKPLFSLATANPNDEFHVGQIADINGEGNAFAIEDLRADGNSDRDYNDIIFQVRGASGKAAKMEYVINPNRDWRGSDLG